VSRLKKSVKNYLKAIKPLTMTFGYKMMQAHMA